MAVPDFSNWREKKRADRSEVADLLISKLESLDMDVYIMFVSSACRRVKEDSRGFLTCVCF